MAPGYKFLLAFFTFILPLSVSAIDKAVISVAKLDANHWRLAGVQITLSDIHQAHQQFSAVIKHAQLPEPLQDVSLIDIRCGQFVWHQQQVSCQQGRAKIVSKHWQSPETGFSLNIKPDESVLSLHGLRLLGKDSTLVITERKQQWQALLNAKVLDLASLAKGLSVKNLTVKTGHAAIQGSLSGDAAGINALSLTAITQPLTGQSTDSRFAFENAELAANLRIKKTHLGWQYHAETQFNNGAAYFEPVFLNAHRDIKLTAEGLWQPENHQIYLHSARYQHDNVGTVQGSVLIRMAKTPIIESARITANTPELEKLAPVYLQPFLTETGWEEVTLSGQLHTEFGLSRHALTDVSAVFNQLKVTDPSNRLRLEGGNGDINWSARNDFRQASTLAWHRLSLMNLPIAKAKLAFLAKAHSVSLLHVAELPLLGGRFTVKQFNWQKKPDQEPEVLFEGNLRQVSLEQFSKALNWTPLAGTISGVIPRVQYSNKTLSLDGELSIDVFSGQIKISNLAASGLFTLLPKFYSDIEINRLDLNQLTGKFQFGGITGKLSGYIRQLYLENWQPVSFYAWLGTPDDDNSSHRISQKAVNNIASIGGGGATDLLSRSVLRAFDTFGYDKIGMGCYLYEGVCQLMGVEAAQSGYVIIKGGGLPRIDVIGYNPRVDWHVLLDRLKRVTASDEVIIN